MSIQTVLEEFSVPFGTWDEIQFNVKQGRLAYIAQFPGPVVILKPWASEVSLTNFGYLANSKYKVFDEQNKFLYSGVALQDPTDENNYIFGSYLVDKQYIAREYGGVLHLSFNTINGKKTILIWCCTRLNNAQLKNQVDRWEKQYSSTNNKQTLDEIFLNCKYLPTNSKVLLYFLPGAWNEVISEEDIVNRAISITEYTGNSYISLYPNKSGWYLFKYVIDEENKVYFNLNLENILGPGFQRIRKRDSFYFIGLENASISSTAFSAQLSQLDKRYVWLDNSGKMRIDADIFFSELAVHEGVSSSEANYNTIQVVQLDEQINRTIIENVNVSVKTLYTRLPELTDIMEDSIFKTGMFGIHDPLESEIFYNYYTPDDGTSAGAFSDGSTIVYSDPSSLHI